LEAPITYTYLKTQTPLNKSNIQVGATGLTIQVEIREGYSAKDISTASTKNILIEKPDDSVLTVSGSFVTDGEDGLLYHITSATDLDQEGIYNVQAYIVISSFSGYSTPISFTVYPNLPLDNN